MFTSGPSPKPVTLDGQYCRLEPLAQSHATSLYAAISGEGIEARHAYLLNTMPGSQAQLTEWIDEAIANSERVYFAIVDKQTGLCGGRFSLMNIQPAHRSVELGAVLFGRGVAQTRLATEAVYLLARHVFEGLGYRRLEWKCNSLNIASQKAARRFGFTYEGRFRQHQIFRGQNRDTDWFSIIDSDWPRLKPAYEAWLGPENFDSEGRQLTKLKIAEN